MPEDRIVHLLKYHTRKYPWQITSAWWYDSSISRWADRVSATYLAGRAYPVEDTGTLLDKLYKRISQQFRTTHKAAARLGLHLSFYKWYRPTRTPGSRSGHTKHDRKSLMMKKV